MDHPLLALAQEACDRGLAELDRHTNAVVATKTSSSDVVTAADRAVERAIAETLLNARPQDTVVGEETGTTGSNASGVRWIIDPIDGTVNYTYQMPGYAVSIGVEVDGELEVGVVHDVLHRERFLGVAGQPATMNGRLIHPTEGSDLHRALIGTGFAYQSTTRRLQAQKLPELLATFRDIRRVGAASIDLCWTACGRLDGYFETGLKYWDWAGASVIVRAAGGKITTADPGIGEDLLTIAASTQLFDALRETVGSAYSGS